jgi:DMSO/TMAO reductase YedYZ molybdopterin-dependent catalytic subunit
MSKNEGQTGRRAIATLCSLVFWLLTACATVAPTATPTVTALRRPSVTATSTPQPTATRGATATQTLPAAARVANCALPTVVAPPTPVATVAFGALDRATGLHVTGRPQTVDLTTYRLIVSGLVDHPLRLTYDDLRCLPKVQTQVILRCVGVFEDEATWSGPTLAAVLELAGVQAGAKEIKLVSADKYTVAVPLDAAREPQNLLAYELDGHTLPVLHGFPLRAVFPDLTGNKWLKWLVEIQVY